MKRIIFFLIYLNFVLAKIYIREVRDLSTENLKEEDRLLLMTPKLRSQTMEDLDKAKSTMYRPVDEELIDDLNLNQRQREILRKRWTSSCDKKASKVCKKACRRTYKSVCSSFKCRRRMKKQFRKECKKHCKDVFLSS